MLFSSLPLLPDLLFPSTFLSLACLALHIFGSMILALSIFVPFALLHMDSNNKFLVTFLLFILHLCKLFVCYAIFVIVLLFFFFFYVCTLLGWPLLHVEVCVLETLLRLTYFHCFSSMVQICDLWLG